MRLSSAIPATSATGRGSTRWRRTRWPSLAYADAAGIADPTARLLNQVGLLLLAKARYAEAEPLLRRALAIDEASLGDAHPEVATASTIWPNC
jgi:Flp pilus assembly protein TadD